MTEDVKLYGTSERIYLEVEGEEALERAKNILSQFDNPEGVTFVRIVAEQERVEDVSISDILTDNGAVEEEHIEEEPEIIEPGETRRDTVLQAMYRKPNEFWHTPDVRDHLPEDHNIPETSLSKVLWSLADEGFIDKKDSERDKRMNKYKLTSKGLSRIEGEQAEA